MAEKHRQVFRKMNRDVDVRSLQPGEFRWLNGGITVSGRRATTRDGNENVISSIYGNEIVANASLEADSEVVGFLEDRISNRAFFAVYNPNTNHTIYKLISTPAGGGGDPVLSISVVMRTSLFGFVAGGFVDMDIIGNILIITNGVSEIFKIDVTKSYGTLSKEKITLIKRPPQLPVTLALAYDLTTYPVNKLAGNYFRFYWRYIYENYDYSVFSPCSRSSNSYLAPTSTTCRLATSINISLTGTGVKDIGESVTIVADERILVTAQTNPVENGIYLAKAGAWVRTSDFAAGGAVDIVVYVREGYKLNFDTTWRVHSTNVGTTDTIADRIEGPNYITVTRPETPPATVIGVEYAVRINESNELIVYRKEDVTFSSSHTFYNDSYLSTVPDADSVTWNDSIPLKSKSLKIFKSRLILFNNTEGYAHATTTQIGLTATSVVLIANGAGDPFAVSFGRFVSTAKRGASYSVGVVFFDFARRHSGVKLIQTIRVPYSNATYKGFKITAALTATEAADVPAWATHFSIVMTKPLDVSYFLQNRTNDIFHFKKDATGDYSYSKTLSGFSAQGSAIDIGVLAALGTGYTYQAGDIIRLFRSSTEVIELLITGQEGRFLLTRTITEIVLSTTVSDAVSFEILTPKQGQEPFYETGFTYPIASFSTTSVALDGDVEVVRTNYYRNQSSYSSNDPYANTYVPYAIEADVHEAMNLWPRNFNKWVKQGGRSLVQSPSLEINKNNYLRYSQIHVQNSSVFGLNSFYAIDEYALPVDNGPGVILAEAGNVLVGLHEKESSAIYVGEGFVNTAKGSAFLSKTDSVIGDDQRYLGGHGTIHPGSAVSQDGKVYWYDATRGCAIRRSQDGLTKISDYGMKALFTYLTAIFNRAPSTSTVVGGWDPQYECYCLTFRLNDLVDTTRLTLYFHEKSNGWVAVVDLLFAPIRFGRFLEMQLAFSDTANLWRQTPEDNYNNFFGSQVERQIVWEIAPLESLVKILESVELDQENIWLYTGDNAEILSVYLYQGGDKETMINYADFKYRDGVWRSAFFNKINDANFGSTTESKYKSPYKPRGQSFYMTLAYNGTDKNTLKSIITFFRPKMNSSA